MDKQLTKILVVDDDPALRQLLAEYLNRHGYDTLLAPDASDITQRITKFSPDLIVLDRMLPGGDGVETCRRLRAQNEDIPVILLTAKDETADRIIGLESGADDYLGKPFDPRELLARSVQVKLTGGEINLLEALVKNSGKPLSRERLLALARDDDEGERNDRAIDIAILRLRRAVEDDPKDPRWIQTVWGIGYRFSPDA